MSLPIQLSLPESFFNEETLCEYHVNATMKKVWAVQLDLLNKFVEVCDRHGIKYQVFAGTLLGLVRHQGFIPWDDDIDVALDRESFEKLVEIGPKVFSDPYFFQTALTDRETFLSEARLRNSRTTAYVKGQSTVGSNNGIYIDIFVLDGVVKSPFLRCAQNLLKVLTRKILTSYYRGGGRKGILDCLFANAVMPMARKVKYETWYRIYHRVLAMYTAHTNLIGLVTHSNSSMQKYALTKDEFLKYKIMEFEGLKVRAPEGYEEVLKRIYGDYMSFPPVSARGKWHGDVIMFDPEHSYMELKDGDAC